MRYSAWASHTCWSCRATGGPRLHVSSRGYRATSPCDTAPRVVEAATRAEAVKQARAALRKFLAK